MFSWLSPFFKAIIENENEKIILTVYVFHKHILRRNIKLQGNNSNKINFIRQLKPTYVNLQTSYGFRDPSLTGIICGVINLVSEYMDLDSVYNDPHFDIDDTYFNINAQVNVNLASMLIKYIQYYVRSFSKETLYGNR
ncbi:hypothetical protein HGI79_12440 [Clostridium sp. DJ247]|nr:hypothetical protein [Clostridium sp. DJ247]